MKTVNIYGDTPTVIGFEPNPEQKLADIAKLAFYRGINIVLSL